MFIVIEGTDGSGKATQSRLLTKRLKKEGKKAVHISFPRYATPTGKKIRAYLAGALEKKECLLVKEVAELYAADRDAFEPTLRTLLKENDVVVCDRYRESNLAHQGAKIPDKEARARFLAWLKKRESHLPAPDLCFFLDVPIPATRQLMQNRAQLDIHERDFEYLKKTRAVYQSLAKKEAGWISIACAEKKGGVWHVHAPEKIHKKIWRFVERNI